MHAYWSPHVDEGGGDSFYGYGWVVLEEGTNEVITHDGGNRIFLADMAIVPADELVSISGSIDLHLTMNSRHSRVIDLCIARFPTTNHQGLSIL